MWYARGDHAGNGHSKKATKLAKTMIDFLMENEGCAEMFPYDVVQNLSDDYEFDVDITAQDIIPENFETPAAILKMIERLENED